MAVDQEFYVYRFGRPRPGRTDGRADGGGRKTDGRTDGRRTGGRRADGRADRRKGGRAAGPILNDSTTIFIDFHIKHQTNLVFVCRFASDGSTSTDFYSSNEKGVQNTSKKYNVF